MLPRHIRAMMAADGFRPEHPTARGATSELEYSGLRLRVLRAKDMTSYQPKPREAVISIRGRTESALALSSRFDAILRLHFDDTGPFASYAVRGDDDPTTMSEAQAREVADFVLQHAGSSALVIQCTAGVSRSRSLAAAVSVALSLPYDFTVVNDDAYRALLAALRAAMLAP